jgi:putative hemolysin
MSVILASIFTPIILAVAGIFASAIFSGLETGLYVVDRVRLAVRAGRGDRNAVRLEAEVEEPERLLSALLIANNAANYAGSLGIAAILSMFVVSEWTIVGLNTLLVVPLLFVFGETIPKDLFRTNADHWMLRFTPQLVWMRRAMTVIGLVPLLGVVARIVQLLIRTPKGIDTTARARVSRLFRESAESGALTEEQLDLADRVLSMRRLTVSGEMTPWRQVITATEAALAEDPTRLTARTRRSRLPVVDGQGGVVGVVMVQDLLLGRKSIEEMLDRNIPRFAPETSAMVALEILRVDHRPLGIVESIEGRPLGVVTLKDLVEPLLGDLRAW